MKLKIGMLARHDADTDGLFGKIVSIGTGSSGVVWVRIMDDEGRIQDVEEFHVELSNQRFTR